ncbi:hypothetical protein IB262_30970 [Ensifer sp. ENS02]|uniref:hypothetical protein n=1 Tax=Ensifer sp. ENS02 TaxID=2769290 RepID=UPI001786A93A|nr:hypothetical protein [Ensifer sp. ENS02]MBD9524307.1 hypothetical protein [Ensifer sp. ENS02]
MVRVLYANHSYPSHLKLVCLKGDWQICFQANGTLDGRRIRAWLRKVDAQFVCEVGKGFGFLTCEANAVVKPIHGKAMPVPLTSEADIDLWMTAEWDMAEVLQRPYPNEAMAVLPAAMTTTERLLI